MMKIGFQLSQLARSGRGATAIEYGLIVSLIALTIVASLGRVNGGLKNTFNNISSKF